MNLEDQIKAQIEREVLQKELGLERFKQQLDKRKIGKDYSRSPAGKCLTGTLLGAIVCSVEEAMEKTITGAGVNSSVIGEHYAALKAIQKINLETGEPTGQTFCPWDHSQTALITFRSMLDVAAMPIYTTEEWKRGRRGGGRPTLYGLHQEVGQRLQMQVILNYLREYFPDKAYRDGFITRLLAKAYTDHASAKHKDTVTKIEFARLADWFDEQNRSPLAELFRWNPWTNTLTRQFGAKLVSLVQGGCHLAEGVKMFREISGSGGNLFLDLTEDGAELAQLIDTEAAEKAFWDLPMLCPPVPHTQDRKGGYLKIGEVRQCKPADGKHKGFLHLSDLHLEFLNRQANVPLRINKKILRVMEEIALLRGDVRNVGKFMPLPMRDDYVDTMPTEIVARSSKDPEKRRWRKIISSQSKAFLELETRAKRLRTEELLKVARLCQDNQQFWLPTQGDFRGRTYPTAALLSYQGVDPSKALLEFAEGYEMDDRTKYWMEIDLSGHMGFDKRSYQDRLQAVQDHLALIISSVSDPIHHEFWKSTDKPWQFLATAQEYIRLFVNNDSDRTTHCRVSIDATCSGQQLISGLTRSLKTAQQVNLVPLDQPSDVYGAVMRVAAEEIRKTNLQIHFYPNGKSKPAELIAMAKLKELVSDNEGDRRRARSGGKGIILVAQYGAGHPKRRESFSEKCKLKAGTFSEAETAALYPFLDAGVKASLEALDPLLSWVQSVVRAALVDQEGQFRVDPNTGKIKNTIYLPAADGSITLQRYRLMDSSSRISVDHLGSAIAKRYSDARRLELDNKPTNTPDLEKHISSTTANLIHCQDGAALAIALGNLDVPFTTNHDSIAGRPGREMDVITTSLLKAYYQIFTSGVLRRFVELNGLEWNEYPAPDFGTYDPVMVLEANYAFC